MNIVFTVSDEKNRSLKRSNYKELKLTDPFLKIVMKVVQKLVRQQVDISEMQFGFLPGQELKAPFLSGDT